MVLGRCTIRCPSMVSLPGYSCRSHYVGAAARFAGVPYTLTAHAKDIFHESVRPDDVRRKLADAASVVTVSDYNLEYLRNDGPAAQRVRRIYNGLDLERFPDASPRERSPRILGSDGSVEKKGFAVLIEGCAILADKGREVTGQIVGTGPQAPAESADRTPGTRRSSRSARDPVPRASWLVTLRARRCSLRPVSWVPTGTATDCRPSFWRRWPWAPPASRPP